MIRSRMGANSGIFSINGESENAWGCKCGNVYNTRVESDTN